MDESFFNPIEDLDGNKFRGVSIKKASVSKLEKFRDELMGFLKKMEITPFSWDILNDVDLDPPLDKPGIPELVNVWNTVLSY